MIGWGVFRPDTSTWPVAPVLSVEHHAEIHGQQLDPDCVTCDALVKRDWRGVAAGVVLDDDAFVWFR